MRKSLIGWFLSGVSYLQQQINSFRTRVLADSGTYELGCLASQLATIQQKYYDRFYFLLTPNGYKASKLYSIKPSSGAGDLTFTRASLSSRVNSSGTVEQLSSNVPNINYFDDDCPFIYLEVARVNLFLNSETLSTQGVTVTAQAYTVSFMGTGTITFSGAYVGSLVGTGASDLVQLTFTPSAGTVTCTVTGSVKYANFEAGSFATSWMPTTGSTLSRPVETITNLNLSAFITSEGCVYFEFLGDNNTVLRQISLSDGTSNNRITLGITNTTVSYSVTVGGSSLASISTAITAGTLYKVSYSWKLNRAILAVNGVTIGRDTALTIPTVTHLSFSRDSGSSTNRFSGKIRALGISAEAFTEPEIEELTNVPAVSTFDIDTDFDVANFQSDDPDNDFVLSGTEITQWNSRSGTITSATQGTSANRPLLVSGKPTFDGSNDFLTLNSEISRNTFTLFIITKATSVPTTSKIPVGGSSLNDFISLRTEADNSRFLQINNVASGGLSRDFRLWGEEYYQVISIRKNTTTLYCECNGRELITLDGTSNSVASLLGLIGKSSSGSNWAGEILAVCMATTYLSQVDHDKCVSDFFTRYSLPEDQNAVVGLGDSITLGSGSTDRLTTAWLPTLASSLSKTFKNYGVGGSILTSYITDGMVARYRRQIVENPYTDTVCILGGTNDSGSAVTAETFEYAYRDIITGLIISGYSQSRIILGTVPYKLGDADAALIATYNTVITNLCTEYGLKAPADVYNQMKNNGGDALMDDTVHPNDAGHDIIAGAFLTVINS
jgi:lysophospholipase L1-like esterase